MLLSDGLLRKAGVAKVASLSIGTRSTRDARKAGTTPNKRTVKTETNKVKNKTRAFGETSSVSASFDVVRKLEASSEVQKAISNPSTPPARDSNRLSVKS